MDHPQQTSLPWHIVEAAVQKEKKWLLSAFDFGFHKQNNIDDTTLISAPIGNDEMLRQISIAVVSGKLQAREVNSTIPDGLWTNPSETLNTKESMERHGGEWHRLMMHRIKRHFTQLRFEVVNEPSLNQGRADLGVYKQGFLDLYVEVGSTSIYKTWINLLTMPSCIFLFATSNDRVLEFKTHSKQ